MSRRATAWLAWALFVLSLLLLMGSFTLVALGTGIATPGDVDLNVEGIGFVVAFFAFPLVGVVIASRRPRNAIGWLFLAVGLGLALSNFSTAYADYGLFADPGSLPGAVWVAWPATWSDPFFFLAVSLLLVLFPDGRPVSRRWRPVLWLLAAAAAVGVLSSAFRPGPIFEESLPVENPLGVEALAGTLDAVDTVVFLLFGLAIVVSGASAIARFRRARGEERQQLKWLALAAGLLITGFVAMAVAGALGAGDKLAGMLIGIAVAAVPVAAGIAILKYRLYEIDRIVNRTLVYAAVTALLAGLYFGIVIGLQAAFSGLARGNDLAIAGSTLAVAALFRPARGRIQALVDRRFYRRRYDAAQALAAFSARLRDEVDLDRLGHDLGAVVRDTMQPAHVSLWLRPASEAVAVPVTISGRSGDRKDPR